MHRERDWKSCWMAIIKGLAMENRVYDVQILDLQLRLLRWIVYHIFFNTGLEEETYQSRISAHQGRRSEIYSTSLSPRPDKHWYFRPHDPNGIKKKKKKKKSTGTSMRGREKNKNERWLTTTRSWSLVNVLAIFIAPARRRNLVENKLGWFLRAVSTFWNDQNLATRHYLGQRQDSPSLHW